MEYLDFELPSNELMEQYQTCSLVGEESGVDMKLACKIGRQNHRKKRKKSTEVLFFGKEFNYLVIQTDPTLDFIKWNCRQR